MNVDAQTATSIAGPSHVLAALHAASAKTGADFDYLLSTAMRESGLDAQAKSKASSATGLFQFVEQTWLGLVKRFGERHGLSGYADAIQETNGGRYRVDSNDTRSAILALRKNPELSALMAGEAANETKQSLECSLGRDVCEGELSAAHFLGAGAARQLIELNDKDPNCAADAVFPQAAKANRSIFYRADGTAKTIGELYAWVTELPDVPVSLPAKGSAPAVLAHSTIRGATQTPMRDLSFVSDTSPNDPAPSHPAAAKNIRLPPVLRPAMGWSSLEGNPPAPSPMLPQSPLLLSPGVVEILASLGPAGESHSKRAGS
jgi:hypothetical protein